MNDKHNHENNLGSQAKWSRVESIQTRVIFHLLMGSMVRSLDTKSFPAELIFFHTDLQGAQMAGSANEEVREGGGKAVEPDAQAGRQFREHQGRKALTSRSRILPSVSSRRRCLRCLFRGLGTLWCR
jgi:hypothetical protein